MSNLNCNTFIWLNMWSVAVQFGSTPNRMLHFDMCQPMTKWYSLTRYPYINRSIWQIFCCLSLGCRKANSKFYLFNVQKTLKLTNSAFGGASLEMMDLETNDFFLSQTCKYSLCGQIRKLILEFSLLNHSSQITLFDRKLRAAKTINLILTTLQPIPP